MSEVYRLSGLTEDQILAREAEVTALEKQVSRQREIIKANQCVTLENGAEVVKLRDEVDAFVAEIQEQRLVIVEQAVEISRLRRELNRCPE